MKRRTWPMNPAYSRKQSFIYPSMTVPDQSMSMRDLLDRHTRGMPVAGNPDSFFDEDDPIPDLRVLDLTQIRDLAENARDKIAKHKKEADDKAIEKQRAKDRQQAIDEYISSQAKATESAQ